MDLALRNAIVQAITSNPNSSNVVTSINTDSSGAGTINYNLHNLWIDPDAPGFSAGTTTITDEELVRAYLLLRLTTYYQYPATPATLELERVYRPVGRPLGKGGRVDVLVRKPSPMPLGEAFLFIECKAPSKFDEDLKYIDGQLFRLSRQESARPRFLIYYTTELKADGLRERMILIDTQTFPDFQSWDQAGQPITDVVAKNYGVVPKRRYANVSAETDTHRPLDREATTETFNRLRTEIHDVIWGGGGTNNNEVFVIITRLILCKIFDENETPPDTEYRFQRLGDAVTPETPIALIERMNLLYRDAESAYLALPQPSSGPAFDITRVSAEKIAYVVGRLEGLSLTENRHPGDLLGEFFEQIVSQDFTQTKGQFFTPVRLVRFMLQLSGSVDQARDIMLNQRDHLGRPRLPYLIDPACGSGTFLIEYMKLVKTSLGDATIVATLPNRIRESHSVWFSGVSGNVWAREYLFGVENNYDLGLATKVNMVLHGDGSMNIWIKSALLPFEEYWIQGRNNVLGITQPETGHPYPAGLNEQFDLILSNPPFSIKLAPDEKRKIARAFQLMASAQSEAIFIERWYQLLREGGAFCCILPEAILDTSTYTFMRLFLLQSFRIHAIVSLPYDAFRPFTSTKTCILYATKRPACEITAFQTALAKRIPRGRAIPSPYILQEVLTELGWGDDQVFMAEPTFVGYKRRKNLPDLPQPNQLYQEDATGNVLRVTPDTPSTVLDFYRAENAHTPDPNLGFWTSLNNVARRKGFRLDPKYRWLWDFRQGHIFGDPSKSSPISSFLQVVRLPKVPKGDLSQETRLIDLECVEARQAIVRDDAPLVDNIGSDRVRFNACDLVISKLEPYLGKTIISPNPDDLGSTEWVGLKVTNNMPPVVAAYLLMLPTVCEAYRRLQSGKRHARFDPVEFLQLRLQLPSPDYYQSLKSAIEQQRFDIIKGRQLEQTLRSAIDTLFTGNNTNTNV